MGNITIKEYEDIISLEKSAIIMGNGFSINFDWSFANIYDGLFDAHKLLLKKGRFRMKAANPTYEKKGLQGYQNVLAALKNLKEDELNEVFKDGVVFLESLCKDSLLLTKINNTNYFSTLTHRKAHTDVLLDMMSAYRTNNNYKSISIEDWTLLVGAYFSINELKAEGELNGYDLPLDNRFLNLVEVGNISTIRVSNSHYDNIVLNGFVSYLRMIFSIRIFNNGKAVDIQKLERLNEIDTEKLTEHLNQFTAHMTLNYDLILEQLLNKKIPHIHGEFKLNHTEYLMCQSLTMNYNKSNVSFSDLLIGDDVTFKMALPMLQQMALGSPNNRPKITTTTILQNEIIDLDITTVVIFGMGIANDHHILRFLMLAFHQNKNDARIIYSYFNEAEKENFISEYEKVIKYSEDINQFIRSRIKVDFVKTQDILAEYFHLYTNAYSHIIVILIKLSYRGVRLWLKKVLFFLLICKVSMLRLRKLRTRPMKVNHL
ncbi:hypothetical protein ACI2JA_03375 [Alkalihalobacillus sp. NPDC078783]